MNESLDHYNYVARIEAELAAEKEENRKLRMTIGVMEMKEKVRGL